MSVTAEEVRRAVDEGFLAALAEPHLRALILWNGCPYPAGSSAALQWHTGYEAGVTVREQAAERSPIVAAAVG